MDFEEKFNWFVVGMLFTAIVFMTAWYIVVHREKPKEEPLEVVEEHSDVVYDELLAKNSELEQNVEMLEEKVEMLSFEIEEMYSIYEVENTKRTELKDVLNLTEDEITLLSKLVKREAGAEPFECKVLVCIVVFNRMYDSNFKNTLSEVIYEKGQFSPAEDGLEETIPTDDCYFAVKNALSLTYNEINEIYGTDLLFFRAATEEKVFGTNTTYAFTVGKTDFYRLNKKY